jgi:DNA replication protein DnaC
MKDMYSMEEAFNELSKFKGREYVRKARVYSLGDNRDELKQLLIKYMVKFDDSVKLETFKYLPEYNSVIDWMLNSEGKGLFLSGKMGRGKTDIILGVIVPLFFVKYGLLIDGCHATELPYRVEEFKRKHIVYIDELGTELMGNNYGQRFESFDLLLNIADQNFRPILLITTNLDGKMFKERYGDRSLDRIERLCKFITFEGDSLR